jgi:poly(ADP-ribose) glycohydrolase
MIREIFANILSSQQLESAILSYNHRYTNVWNFSTLHSFFEEVFLRVCVKRTCVSDYLTRMCLLQVLDEEESIAFFETIFPKIVDLALCLPQLITDGVPLLRQGYKHSLSLSQVQISCLLANAFLCTFPHRNWNGKNSEYSDYPDINFNR